MTICQNLSVPLSYQLKSLFCINKIVDPTETRDTVILSVVRAPVIVCASRGTFTMYNAHATAILCAAYVTVILCAACDAVI
jgi:hypothetical protein